MYGQEIVGHIKYFHKRREVEAQQCSMVPWFCLLFSVGYAVDSKQDVMRLCLWPGVYVLHISRCMCLE